MEPDHFSATALADNSTFRAYVSRSDPEAVRFWTSWLAQNPTRQKDVDEASRLVQALGTYHPRSLTTEQIESQIQQIQKRTETAPLQLRSRWQPNWVWQAAATVVLVLGLLGSWWFFDKTREPLSKTFTSRAKSRPINETASAMAGPLSYRTGFGERRALLLPDSSEVILNANSELALAVDWSTKKREVILKGEAFFRVRKHQHDGNRIKFTVLAKNTAIEVLGTQFDVATRNRKVKVVLKEGKIRIRVANTRTYDLLPGELIEVTDRQAVTFRNQVAVQEHAAWTTNELVFNETPLSDISQLIENNYGYRVAFADPTLASRRLTATLPDNNLDILLRALEKAFSLTITRKDKMLLIQSLSPSKP